MSSNNTIVKLTTVLLVVMIGLSIAASGGVGGQASTPDAGPALDSHAETSANATNPADEVHVSDDGEVALVYRGNASGDVTETRFGVDVATGLASALVVSEANTSGAAGNLSAVLTPDRISAAGDAAINESGNLTALDLSANVTRTDAESSFDASLVAAANATGTAPAGFATNGSATVAPDAFRMSARVESENGSTSVPLQPTKSDVTIQGTDTGYTVSVAELRPGANETMWGNESAANDTLSAQFGPVASQLNGSSEVTINSHAYDNGTLDVDYTVTLTDVKEGVARTLVGQFEDGSALNLTVEERERLVDGLTNVTVDEISVSQNRTGGTTTAAASVRISNYQSAVIDFMEISAARNTTLLSTEDVDRYRDTVAARESANLVQQTTWNASVSQEDNESRVDVDVAYDSDNWSAYVTELEARGIDSAANVTASLSAELVDDGIDVEGSFELRRADLVGDAIGALQARMDPNETADGGQATELLRALRNSEFQTAKSDVDFGNGTVTLRAGAQFDNVSALRNATADVFGDAPIGQIYGESDAAGATTYVYLGESRSVDELEAMGLVDNETAVVENSTEISAFPRMNTTEAAQFLGVEVPSDGGETPTPTPTDGGGGAGTPTTTDDGAGAPTVTDDDGETVSPGQPGFGVVLTALVVVLAAVLAARRR